MLHANSSINLFEVAGYAPIGCRGEGPVRRAAWRLVYKDTEYRVALGDLRVFLDNGPDAAPEFQLIAAEKRVLQDMLRVAKRKLRQMAIRIQPTSPATFEIKDTSEMIVRATGAGAAALAVRIKSSLSLTDLCDLPAVVVFGYDPAHNGLASTFGSPTAATARSNFMARLFGIVLAHEMGHCFDLRHDGHHGLENIMFTTEEEAGLARITGNTVVEYLLAGGEPRFTRDDAKHAWTWLLTKASGCF